jgi:hypothetical protein
METSGVDRLAGPAGVVVTIDQFVVGKIGIVDSGSRVDMHGSTQAVLQEMRQVTATPVPAAQPVATDALAMDRAERLRGIAAKRWKDLLLYGVVIMVVAYGWQMRGDVYLSPEQGVGYVLGIIGASLILLLLLYPLRKHAGWMRRLGQVRHWFRMHMMLGIIGPVCILYHCNFQLGSLNGNVALFSMLVVAVSGLAGRYFYTRIHYGLYGRKADLEHLGSDAADLRNRMHALFESAPGLREMLGGLEQETLRLPDSLSGSLAHLLVIAVKSRLVALRAGQRIRRAAAQVAGCEGGGAVLQRSLRTSGLDYLRVYLLTVRRVAGFTFYERLFGLWHVLHLPLFVMLLITGIIHVYAVHMY